MLVISEDQVNNVSPPVEFLQDSVFFEGNKSLTTSVFQSYVIFLKMMYFQSDEKGVLDVLEIKLFLKPYHGGQTFKYFFLLVGSTL